MTLQPSLTATAVDFCMHLCCALPHKSSHCQGGLSDVTFHLMMVWSC
jgi:hypothetical protein